ncbi:hypothetical protein [Saccharopolyspora sp. NPDC002376]
MRIIDEIAHFTNADTGGRPICFHTVTFLSAELAPSAPVVLSLEEHDTYRWLLPAEAFGLDLVWHVRCALEAPPGQGVSGEPPLDNAGDQRRVLARGVKECPSELRANHTACAYRDRLRELWSTRPSHPDSGPTHGDLGRRRRLFCQLLW